MSHLSNSAFELTSSRYYWALLLAIHVLIGYSMKFSNLSSNAQFIIYLLLLGNLLCLLAVQYFSGNSLQVITINAEGWSITLANGKKRLFEEAIVALQTPVFIVLKLNSDCSIQRVVIFKDQLSAGLMHQLLLSIRLFGHRAIKN